MLKETKDLSGLKLFWAVEIGASQKDIQHSTQDNIWMMEKIGNHIMHSYHVIHANTDLKNRSAIDKTYLFIHLILKIRS